MKAKVAVITAVLIPILSVSAQLSSQDNWDAKFHPKAVVRRQNQRIDAWLASWQDRLCQAQDVKRYWLITLTKIEPDIMDSQYYQIREQNARLSALLFQSDTFDFDAQILADRINIAEYRRRGLMEQAVALARESQARIKQHEEEQFRKEVIARIENMRRQFNYEFALLQDEITSLNIAVNNYYHSQH